MFARLLAAIAGALDHQGIPYMVIGGQAVLLHGEPRLTRDIDVTLGVDVDHLEKLLAAVETIPLKPLPDDVPSFVQETRVLPALDEATGIRVDFIFSFSPYETEAIGRSKEVRIQGAGVRFASAEDLIIHKVFAGRPRDIDDVRTVLLKNPGIDRKYIRKWLTAFDSALKGKALLESFEELDREER